MTNTPNFRQGVGRMATDRLDFESHLKGTNPDSNSSYVTSFRHKASQIDVDDPSLVYGSPSNVEDALENIKDYITILSNAGQGFITVGDGYNSWHAADGNINFDPSIPTLDTLLNPIFATISSGVGIPEAYTRVKYGGIIVIKSGTYVIADTIEVPPGIIIMGEGYGTKLVNITSLTIPAIGLPPTPKGAPTPKPLFRILPDLNRSVNDNAVDPNLFMFSRTTKFMNLVIADNFVENTILGDVYYKLPQNKTGSNPLIQQTSGSNLELINVFMLGRVSFSSGTIVSEATRFAIQLDNTTGVVNGTVLKLTDCFIDGFSQPINFDSIGGTNDYVEIDNCKIRSHGYLDADGTSGENNCIINMNDNNAVINANYFYGNHSACKTILNIASVVSLPALQSISKIIISNNDFAINKGGAGAITPVPVTIDAGITTTILTRATLLLYANSFQDNYGFNIENASKTMFSVSGTQINLPLSIKNKTYTVSTSTYSVDSVDGSDYILFINSLAAACSITLPAHENGRTLIIKDTGFNASINNIILIRNGSTGKIEDYTGDLTITTNGISLTLVSDGSNWNVI